jgi:hypothetical protein
MAVVKGGVASVTLPSALSVGNNRLQVAIDRPGTGRDETVSVTVHVAYRIRPDLTTLDAERPSLQVVADVASGTAVTLGGHALSPIQGRAVESLDVTDECTGLASDVVLLSRRLPYEVVPAEGAPERGLLSISVGIVPLQLEAPVPVGPGLNETRAPRPHVITSGPSFVLAGRTMRGAELLAAGRAIPVHPDGTFAQVMNVSAIGATELEVRAKAAGMAPRLAFIHVRRVESLEKAAAEFVTSQPIVPYATIAGDVPASVGKAVSLAGEASETKRQGYQTIIVMQVSQASGCPAGQACLVRLVQAGESVAKRGEPLRAYGHVSRAFTVQGRPDIPEIEVDIALKGQDAATERR